MTAMAALVLIGFVQCGSESGGGVKTVTLPVNCFKFATGEQGNNCGDEWDLIVEPWYNGRAGICGNWVQTSEGSLDSVTTPPASGYISDVAGYQDCQEVDGGMVLVFKLKDGTYAKAMLTKVEKDAQGCVTSVTMSYVYPM